MSSGPLPTWRRSAPGRLVGVLAVLLLVVVVDAPGARADTWLVAPTVSLATGSPFGDVPSITAIACPTATVCVAGDAEGAVLTTHDPADSQPAWSGRTVIDPPAGPSGSPALTGLSCPTSGLCVAVDRAGNAIISTDPGEAQPTWSAPARIDPAAALTDVSCPTADLCVAVDGVGNALVTTDPTASSPTWKTVPLEQQQALVAVSCASATLCAAIDGNGQAMITTQPATVSATAWASHSSIAKGATGVSCVSGASTSLCVVVDSSGGWSVNSSPASSGSSWSATSGFDPSHGLTSVDCPTVAFCVTGDNAGGVLSPPNPSSPGSGTWTRSAPLSQSISAVACAGTTSACLAAAPAPGGAQFATTSQADTTTPTWQVTPSADALTRISGMTCPTTTWCLAADTAGTMSLTSDPTSPSPAWSSGRVQVDAKGGITALSCGPYDVGVTTSVLCAAADTAGNVLFSAPSTSGFTLSSGSWSTSTTTDTNRLTGVSCTGVSLCVAVDAAGDFLTSQPGQSLTWSSPKPIDGGTALNGVACPSLSECVAVDAHGGVLITRDPTNSNPVPLWTTFPLIDPGHALNAIACPSVDTCLAVDDAGRLLETGNASAATPVWSAPVTLRADVPLLGVSCSSLSACGVAAADGSFLVSGSPGSPSSWQDVRVGPAGDPVYAVACQPTLCAAGDGLGAATTAVPGYGLTVALAGSGGGSVAAPGLTCAAACTGTYRPGTFVALTATPASGSTFTGWSGGGCAGAGPCLVAMGGDTAVTATFARLVPRTPAPRCALHNATVHVLRAKRLSFSVTCDRPAVVTLSASLFQRVHVRVRVRHGRRTTLRLVWRTRMSRLPAVHRSLKPRRRLTLRLSLPRTALEALAHHTGTTVTVALSARGSGGTRHLRPARFRIR